MVRGETGERRDKSESNEWCLCQEGDTRVLKRLWSLKATTSILLVCVCCLAREVLGGCSGGSGRKTKPWAFPSPAPPVCKTLF